MEILFVTVDPDRDTSAVLNEYARASTPQMEGLARRCQPACRRRPRRYRVAYSVKPGPPYEVMHSNAVFFFDASGRARLVTTDTGNSAAMAEDVRRLLTP